MIRWEVNKELTDRGGHRGGHLQCGNELECNIWSDTWMRIRISVGWLEDNIFNIISFF